jgi:hypothetical protein
MLMYCMWIRFCFDELERFSYRRKTVFSLGLGYENRLRRGTRACENGKRER